MLVIKCKHCDYVYDYKGTVWSFMTQRQNCPCCGSTYVWPTFRDDQPIFLQKDMNTIIKEELKMKREQKVENQEQKLRVYRVSDTSRGIFKVKDLEPTDMFVLVCDEEQNVYMVVGEEEPKYKTKKAVVKMVSGELSWIEDDTLIHVYRRPGVELRVGDFEYPND